MRLGTVGLVVVTCCTRYIYNFWYRQTVSHCGRLISLDVPQTQQVASVNSYRKSAPCHSLVKQAHQCLGLDQPYMRPGMLSVRLTSAAADACAVEEGWREAEIKGRQCMQQYCNTYLGGLARWFLG